MIKINDLPGDVMRLIVAEADNLFPSQLLLKFVCKKWKTYTEQLTNLKPRIFIDFRCKDIINRYTFTLETPIISLLLHSLINSNIRILKWLNYPKKHYSFKLRDAYTICGIYNLPNLIRYLYREIRVDGFDENTIIKTTKFSLYFSTKKNQLSEEDKYLPVDLIRQACESGNLNIIICVREMLNKEKITSSDYLFELWNYSNWKTAARCGHIHILEWVAKNVYTSDAEFAKIVNTHNFAGHAFKQPVVVKWLKNYQNDRFYQQEMYDFDPSCL